MGPWECFFFFFGQLYSEQLRLGFADIGIEVTLNDVKPAVQVMHVGVAGVPAVITTGIMVRCKNSRTDHGELVSRTRRTLILTPSFYFRPDTSVRSEPFDRQFSISNTYCLCLCTL